MFRPLLGSLALLTAFAVSVRAADIQPEVSGVAEFFATTPRTDIITSGDALPGGGRAFELGQFGPGGALCTTYSGQTDYLCASASARVEIDRILVGTSTFVGTSTSVRLKSQVHLDYRNATAYSAQIWAEAKLTIPLACHAGVVPPTGGLRVTYHLSGEHSVSVSDAAVTVKAPPPFEDCDQSGVCAIKVPTFHCPDEGFTTSIELDLRSIIQIENIMGHTGWSVLGVSDYSHTFTLDGIDLLDTNGDPIPDVRLVVPDDQGGANDEFLTTDEAAEVAAASTTTTTTISSDTSTTTTTAPPCQTGDLAAAQCRCGLRPVAGCEGVTLKGAIAKGLNGLCAKVQNAAVAVGKKQIRLAKQAGKIGQHALKALNGRKAKGLPDVCRSGLQAFFEATRIDLASTLQ